MLAGLGAATLGGVLSLFGQEPGQAARKKKNRKRQQSKRRGKPRSSGVRAQAKNGKNKKVGVCHRTGSATNPLVFIEVSENAADTHTRVDCNDNNECTIDDCDPVDGCFHTPVDCDDNDACTVDTCHPATGCSYALRNCDDGNECTQNLCNPATGCFFPPRPGAPCANGNGICNQTGQCIPRQGVCGGPSGGPCICRNRATGQPCPSQGPCPQPNPPFQLACPSDSCLCIA